MHRRSWCWYGRIVVLMIHISSWKIWWHHLRRRATDCWYKYNPYHCARRFLLTSCIDEARCCHESDVFIGFVALIKIRYDKGGTSRWMWGIFICGYCRCVSIMYIRHCSWKHIYFHPLGMVHRNECTGIESFVKSTEEYYHRKKWFLYDIIMTIIFSLWHHLATLPCQGKKEKALRHMQHC